MTLDRLLATMCGELAQGDYGVRRLEFRLYRVDNTMVTASIGTSRPSRDARHLARLFQDKIVDLDMGFGIDVAALLATRIEPQDATQSDLEGQTTNRLHEDTAQLVDRLSGRFGPRRVTRLHPVASYLPERARCEVSAARPVGAREWFPEPDEHVRSQPRPLQLLVQPAPIEVMAPVPDGPPVMFRWRKQQHRIRAAEGPERIAPEWWQDEGRQLTPELRDYYRVEDADGQRFWVFREGLFRPDKAPNWYLHGFFA
jgi:protein ImuB